ncbi:MAG: metallophosphoesterase [Spirochaetes bacterium]|nr:metallophosphoesterase [Spirochaetota bacterium]
MRALPALLLLSSLFALDPGKSPNFRFAVAGDSRGNDEGINRAVLEDLRDGLLTDQVSLVLFPGDLVTGPKDHETMVRYFKAWNQTFAAPLRKAGIPVYPCRGNHDLVKVEAGADALAAWKEVILAENPVPANGPATELGFTYAVAAGENLFLSLDVYGSNRMRTDTRWLGSLLATNKLPHIFAFSHVPLYNLAGKAAHPDGYGWTSQGSNKFQSREERDGLVGLLTKAGADAYFCGHDHWLDVAAVPQNTGRLFWQFLSGGAGAPIRTWSQGGYRDPQVSNVGHADQFGYMVAEVGREATVVTVRERVGEHSFTNWAPIRVPHSKAAQRLR